MPIEVIDEIVDKNGAGFPVTDQKRVRGGYQVFSSFADRAAFDTRKLTLGMRSFVVDQAKDYRLDSVASVTWTEIVSGGGGGITALTGDVTASGTGSVAATIPAGSITDAKVASANKDGAASSPSMRTIGTGLLQAAAGSHAAQHVEGVDPLYVLDLVLASRFGGYFPAANSNVAPVALGAPTWAETAGAQSNTSTANMFASMQRRGYTSTAVAGSIGGGRSQPFLFRSLTGFRYFVEFGISDAAYVVGARMFVGLRASSGTPVDVQIDTLLSMIGVGHEAGDAGLSVFSNDTGAATKVALNVANFPVTTTGVDVFRAEISTRQATGDVLVAVTNLTTGVTESVIVASDLPPPTTLLTPTAFRSNGVSALQTRIELFRVVFDSSKGRP